ncbi:MAG: AlwI family type II restriction endonuclease, partial [Patescibacteria group bacterium]
YWLIEVTLIRNKVQQLNSETTSVIRHLLTSRDFGNYEYKYLSFIAPFLHEDTKSFYDTTIIKNAIENNKVSLNPYSLADFIEITTEGNNLRDMENYTEEIRKDLRNKLILQ